MIWVIAAGERQKSGAPSNSFLLRVLSSLQAGPETHRITSLPLPHFYSKACCIHSLVPTRLVVVYWAIKGVRRGDGGELGAGADHAIDGRAWLPGPDTILGLPSLARFWKLEWAVLQKSSGWVPRFLRYERIKWISQSLESPPPRQQVFENRQAMSLFVENINTSSTY